MTSSSPRPTAAPASTARPTTPRPAATGPASTRRPVLVTVGAVALLGQAVSLPAELVGMALSALPYDPVRQTISDLGSTTCTAIPYPSGDVEVCSPAHAVVNGGMVLAGLLVMVASVCLAGAWWRRSRPLAVAAVGTLALTGASTLATGLVPLDVDLMLHSLVSLPAILVGPIAAMVLAVLALRGPLRVMCLVAAALALVAAVVMLGTVDSGGIMGLTERIAVWIPVLVMALVGAVELRRWSRGRNPC